jgi:hypothetical protein
MDTVRTIVGRLITRVASVSFVVLLGVFSAFYSPSASATTYSQAMSSCQAYLPVLAGDGYPTENCQDMGHTGGTGQINANACQASGACHVAAGYPYTWSSTNPCDPAAHPAQKTFDYSAKPLLAGYSINANATDPNTGATIQCATNVAVSGGSVWVPNLGQYETAITVSFTGSLSSGAGWVDGSGAALVPQPGIPTLNAVNVTAPAVCGDSSCYTPTADTYKATTASGDIGVSGAAARSSTGGCSSGSGAAVCAGSPGTIPAPPPAIIPDPATQVQGSATYTQVNPSTGAAQSVTVVTYGLPGTSVKSGQQSGDNGPAPASTSPTADHGAFAGGTDCTSPPVCSGDAVMCGAARTQWATTCQLHTDLAGPTGKAPTTLAADNAKYSQSDVWVTPTAGNTVGDAANAGNYDQTGGGAPRTCPLTDFHFGSVAGLSVKFSIGCDPLLWLAYVGWGFALYRAARITAGSAW